jgi:hypothetical protein
MKCLSVHQPWAHAILHLGKNVENRVWSTRHRGPLLIHAAKARASLNARWPVPGLEFPATSSLTFGAILGVVDLIGCVKVGPDGDLGLFGQSSWGEEGMFGWVLANPRPFKVPIPYRGAQGLFEVGENVAIHHRDDPSVSREAHEWSLRGCNRSHTVGQVKGKAGNSDPP